MINVIDLTNDDDDVNNNDERNGSSIMVKRKAATTSRNDFVFVTININKITSKKVNTVINEVDMKLRTKPDIIFVQETKLTQAPFKNIAEGYCMHHNSVWTEYEEYKHGNCVLVRTDSPLAEGNLINLDWDLEGRIVAWDTPYGIFVGVYAATPNNSPSDGRSYTGNITEMIPKRYEHRKDFDEKLQKFLREQQVINRRTIIALGDWNVVSVAEDSTTDDPEGTAMWGGNYKKCKDRDHNLCKDLNLIDIWRQKNPNLKSYTSFVGHLKDKNKNPTKLWVRIDKILIPKVLEMDVKRIDIMFNSTFVVDVDNIFEGCKDGFDHVPVVMKISLVEDRVYDGEPQTKKSCHSK